MIRRFDNWLRDEGPWGWAREDIVFTGAVAVLAVGLVALILLTGEG